MGEHDVAGALIDQLADEGEAVDSGRFTLDAAAALHKLRAHQLDDPHAYILVLVEAAWLAAATPSEGELAIRLGSRTVVEFRGLALAPGVLAELFTTALLGPDHAPGPTPRHGRVVQLLGLAANSALALAPTRITITAAVLGGGGERATIATDGSVTVAAVDAPSDSIRFELEQGRSSLGPRPERALLERCRASALAIELDGERLSKGPLSELDEADVTMGNWVPITLEGEAIGVLGHRSEFAASVSPSSTITYLVRGVAIVEDLPGEPGLRAVVEVDLPTDLSRRRLVEGPALAEVREAILDARGRLRPAKRRRWDQALRERWSRSPRWGIAAAIVVVVTTASLFAAWDSLVYRRKLLAAATDPPSPPPAAQPAPTPTPPRCVRGQFDACMTLLAQVDAGQLRSVQRSACAIGHEPSCLLFAAESGFDVASDGPLGPACAELGPAACELLNAASLRSHRPTNPGPLYESVVYACLLHDAAPACMEAAWLAHYGFVEVDASVQSKRGPRVLLERACTQGIAQACELGVRFTLPGSCERGDALACYLLGARELEPCFAADPAPPACREPSPARTEALDRLRTACDGEIAEACRAVAIAEGGIESASEPSATAFARACALGDTDSCTAKAAAPQFPNPALIPHGARPWGP